MCIDYPACIIMKRRFCLIFLVSLCLMTKALEALNIDASPCKDCFQLTEQGRDALKRVIRALEEQPEDGAAYDSDKTQLRSIIPSWLKFWKLPGSISTTLEWIYGKISNSIVQSVITNMLLEIFIKCKAVSDDIEAQDKLYYRIKAYINFTAKALGLIGRHLLRWKS
ncbi:unnamed protein product [Diabrotica balteata]|uniref:Uncharacterized protein n=1 Tax=Diabrotica balteata TaxID=107213 RepID=A0A9N9T0Q0_DIABA|nr:unnamed protein product [Diabrotica balteata]